MKKGIILPRSRDERGQSIVLIALGLAALIGFMGLVVDGGEMFFSRRNSQNASDAAAFAGARLLADGTASDADIAAAVWSFAQANHIMDPADVEAYYLDASGNRLGAIGAGDDAGATGVVVTTTIHVGTSFINVVSGRNLYDVRTTAAVQSGPATGADLMPMTAHLPTGCDPLTSSPTCFTYDQPVQLFGDPQAGGAFQWVAFNGANDPNTIAQYLMMNLDSGSIAIGDWVPSGPGIQGSIVIKNALDWWLAKPEPERHWKIPIYGNMRANGQLVEYQVAAIGEFVFLGYDLTGNPKSITGKFVRWTDASPGTAGECNTNGVNICAIWLIQ